MFNIGFSELLILGVIGLLVLGPEQLPVVARKLAKIINDLKRAKDEIMSPVEDLKSEARMMLERAREQAAKLELEEMAKQALEKEKENKPEEPQAPTIGTPKKDV